MGCCTLHEEADSCTPKYQERLGITSTVTTVTKRLLAHLEAEIRKPLILAIAHKATVPYENPVPEGKLYCELGIGVIRLGVNLSEVGLELEDNNLDRSTDACTTAMH